MHEIRGLLLHYGAQLPPKNTGWVKIKCCFHSDSHASAVVNYEQNAFKCFACEAKGNTYTLIMQQEGLEYGKAVEFAERVSAKIDNPVQQKPRTRREISRKPRNNLGRRASILGGGS